MYKMTDSGNTHSFVPTPQEITYISTNRQSLDGWVVVDSTEFHIEAQYLASKCLENALLFLHVV